MVLIFDIIALTIVAVSVFFAYKKGLIKTLFSLLGGIVAIVLAVVMSTPVGNWINEKYVGPAVRNTVLTAVNGSSLAQNYDEALEAVDVVGKLQEMPDSLRSFLENLNVDVNGIIASAEQSNANSMAAKEQLIDSIATPISEVASKAIALIGLAIIFFILLLVVTRLLDAVFRVLPFGKSINKTGGIVFGLIRGVLLVMVLGAVIYGLACAGVLITVEQLSESIIIKTINQINPILTALQ